MKLTKNQRHTAYIILLQELEAGNTCGLCSLWGYIFRDSDWRKLKRILPEVYSKRNLIYYPFWFKTRKERINALKQCIEETY